MLSTGAEFIRQQWRMWIETSFWRVGGTKLSNSFASNGECGLKHLSVFLHVCVSRIHSPAMANVD